MLHFKTSIPTLSTDNNEMMEVFLFSFIIKILSVFSFLFLLLFVLHAAMSITCHSDFRLKQAFSKILSQGWRVEEDT
jgi:hypothetical protein